MSKRIFNNITKGYKDVYKEDFIMGDGNRYRFVLCKTPDSISKMYHKPLDKIHCVSDKNGDKHYFKSECLEILQNDMSRNLKTVEEETYKEFIELKIMDQPIRIEAGTFILIKQFLDRHALIGDVFYGNKDIVIKLLSCNKKKNLRTLFIKDLKFPYDPTNVTTLLESLCHAELNIRQMIEEKKLKHRFPYKFRIEIPNQLQGVIEKLDGILTTINSLERGDIKW